MGRRLKWGLVLCLAVFLLAGACGKKAPPVPLGTLDVPRVRTLSADPENGGAVLDWRMNQGDDYQPLEGFRVLRFWESPDKEACTQCPKNFRLESYVALDRVGGTGEPGLFEIRQTLEKPGRWYFMIIPVGKVSQGQESDVVYTEIAGP